MSVYYYHESCFQAPSSYKWNHPRRNLFIIKVNEKLYRATGQLPKQANERHKIVEGIKWAEYGAYIGSTERCQYEKARAEARQMMEKLKAEGHTVIY